MKTPQKCINEQRVIIDVDNRKDEPVWVSVRNQHAPSKLGDPHPVQSRTRLICWVRDALGTRGSAAGDSSSPGYWLLGKDELGSHHAL